MQLKEEALFTLKFDGKPVINELGELEKKLSDVKEAQKDVEKGTKEWAANKAEIKELEASIKQVREEMGVAGMTVRQLEGYQRQLNREIKDSTVGTDEYKKKAGDLQEVNSALANHRQTIRGVADEAEKTSSVWTNVKTWIASAFSVAVLLEAGRVVLNFFSDSVKEFRAFQSAAQDLSAVTGAVGKDLEYLKNQAKEVGPAMGKSGSEMLEAFKLMASAKPELLSQKELLVETTKAAITLAQAGKIDLAEATKVTAESLNQFGEGAKSANRFINVIAAGAKEGSAEIADMGMSLKASGTVAKAAGLSFEQTNATLQSMSTIALKGEQAGTMLRNVLLKLQAGAKETNPELVGMETALDNVAKKNYTAADMAKLFGSENVVAARHIVEHRKEIAELTTKLTGTNEAYSQAAKNNATYDFEVAKAKATLSTLSVEIGQAFIPAMTKGAQGVVAFVNIIRAVPEFLSENKTAFVALGVAVLAMNGNLIVATATSIGHAAAEKARLIWTNSATAAQWLMNAALTANPIGLVVAAVALLVAGFSTLYNHSTTVRAGIAGLFSALKVAASQLVLFWNAITSLNFAEAAKIMAEGGAKIAAGFNDGYEAEIKKSYPKQLADHKAHVDTKVGVEKTSAQTIATDSVLEHEKSLRAKEKAAETLRKSEEKKAAAAAKKEAEDAVKANEEGRKKIRELSAEAITDELEREKAKIQAKRDAEVEAMQASKASQEVKAEWEKALNAKMVFDINKVEKEYRDKKAQEEEKDRKERDTRERETSKAVAEAAYNAHHQSLEKQLEDTTLKASARKAIEMELINIERTETLRKIADQYAAESQKLAQEKADAIRTAQQKGQSIDLLENQFRQQYQAAELQRRTSETAAEDKFQADKRDIEKKNLEQRKANQQAWFDAIKGLMQGDFTQFGDFLAKKLAGEKKELTDAQKANVDKIDKVGSYAKAGLDALGKLNQLALDKQLKDIAKEKSTQLAAWKDKYDKGLIDKNAYEKGVDKINSEADQKNKAAQLAAFKRQQALDILMAVINGAQAALKSLAMFGWPLGLIGVAGAVVATGIQIALIKRQQPPSMARGGKIQNAGVPDGPAHGSGYGKSGLAITRRDTGEEVAEMEGGEPVMVLSRNTYRNNRRLVDGLMHSSLHRNGAPVMARNGILLEGGGYTQADHSDSVYSSSRSEETSQPVPGSEPVRDSSGDSGGDSGGGSVDSGSAEVSNSEMQAQIDESQKTMASIEKNTALTVDAIKTLVQAMSYLQQQVVTESAAQQNALAIGLTGLRTDTRLGFDGLQSAYALQMMLSRIATHEDLTALQGTMKLELPELGKDLQNELVTLRQSLMLGLTMLRLGISLDVSGLQKTTQTGFDSLEKGVHLDLLNLEKLLHDDLTTLQDGVHLDLTTLDLDLDASLTSLQKAVRSDLNSMKVAQALQASTLRIQTQADFDSLKAVLEKELKNLEALLHGDLTSLQNASTGELRAVQNILNSSWAEQGYQSNLLNRIANKDLSVSVQTFVNVYNQIDVVAGKSDLK